MQGDVSRRVFVLRVADGVDDQHDPLVQLHVPDAVRTGQHRLQPFDPPSVGDVTASSSSASVPAAAASWQQCRAGLRAVHHAALRTSARRRHRALQLEGLLVSLQKRRR